MSSASMSCFLYRRLCREGPAPTAPDDAKPTSPPLRRFSYGQLRRATSSFAQSRKLGQGGFGPVFCGALPDGREVAVKLMDSGSLQGHCEFRNELALSEKLLPLDRKRVVVPIGFCCDDENKKSARWWRKCFGRAETENKRAALVYHLMRNGSLQDALLDRRCPQLLVWAVRFSVALDVAKGLQFLHTACEPPVVHGDIKPSNILLDSNLSAKIADFGLARFRADAVDDAVPLLGVVQPEDDAESTTTLGFEDTSAMSVSEANGGCDRASVDSGREIGASSIRKGALRRSGENTETGGRSVKDYVMEWIKAEITERPEGNLITSSKTEDCSMRTTGKSERKKLQRKSEWWAKLDEDGQAKKTNRPSREWWREEFCEELTKSKKKKEASATTASESSTDRRWWEKDENSAFPPQRKKNRRKNSNRESKKWWKDDCTLSSTPSTRGTVCYVAPEYGGGGPLSEKCDIYSFGVLLLVLISGRRPLQVTASPTSELERASLISWARRLARAGRLMELVDASVREVDREQVRLCITVALLCIQRSPPHRPSIVEVVGMLTGQSERPHLPMEFSPSPPARISVKSRKKTR